MAYKSKQQLELDRKQYQIDKLKSVNKNIIEKQKSKSQSNKKEMSYKHPDDDFFGFFSFLQFG